MGKVFTWTGKSGKLAVLDITKVPDRYKLVTINSLSLNGKVIVTNAEASMMINGNDRILRFDLNGKDAAFFIPEDVVNFIHPRKKTKSCINEGSPMQDDEGNKYIFGEE